jgi:hypothetical protein
MFAFLINALNLMTHFVTSVEFWGGVLIPTVVFIVVLRRLSYTDSVNINIPFGLGSANFNTAPTGRIVAWKLYVQLVTRKAALPFDEQFDLISDVYDSLFELFKITRDLLLELPPHEFSRQEGIATLILRILNSGVRPHLTKWQAEYRDWLEKSRNLDEFKSLSPQEIQCKYPKYNELITDLKHTNTELSKFADELREFSSPIKRKHIRQKKIVPVAPVISSNVDH